MYVSSLGIPMLGWIDDMLGFVQQLLHLASDEVQFQSCHYEVHASSVLHV